MQGLYGAFKEGLNYLTFLPKRRKPAEDLNPAQLASDPRRPRVQQLMIV